MIIGNGTYHWSLGAPNASLVHVVTTAEISEPLAVAVQGRSQAWQPVALTDDDVLLEAERAVQAE